MRTLSLLILGLLLGPQAHAKTVRATEMTSSLWARLGAPGAEELIVEFRQGDELPVTLSAEGDLLETSRSATSYISVKRNFWVKIDHDTVLMSLDGASYKRVQDMLTGSFTAGAGTPDGGGIANAINLGLKANLK